MQVKDTEWKSGLIEKKKKEKEREKRKRKGVWLNKEYIWLRKKGFLSLLPNKLLLSQF